MQTSRRPMRTRLLWTNKRFNCAGQATVEFALLLPFVIGVVLFVIQVGMIGVQALQVQQLAREAARQAALHPNPQTAAQQVVDRTDGLDKSKLRLKVAAKGDFVTAGVIYKAKTQVPIVGRILSDIELKSQTTTFIEAR